jgi:hypothetical protein
MNNNPSLEGFSPIIGYERYLINRKGIVYSTINSGMFLKQIVNSDGYPCVNLVKKGSRHGNSKSIHRLVAQTFIENPDKLEIINHKDGNKTNCDVENLEWCTCLHNNRHSFETGLNNNYGEKHHQAKLTNEEVVCIRLYHSLGVTSTGIAKHYGVSRTTIYSIVKNRKWRRVA